jgi:hypothetical protein
VDGITAATEEVTLEDARIIANMSDMVTSSSLNVEWVIDIEETKMWCCAREMIGVWYREG